MTKYEAPKGTNCVCCGVGKHYNTDRQILAVSDGGLVEMVIQAPRLFVSEPERIMGSFTICLWCQSYMAQKARDAVITEVVEPMRKKLELLEAFIDNYRKMP